MRTLSTLFALLLALLFASPRLLAQEGESLPPFTGRIAYVGTDFNIYSLGGELGETTMLTSDAGRVSNGFHLYQWPTWSRDGRLAYFRIALTSSGNLRSTDVFVSPDGVLEGNLLYSGEDEAFTYAYWSPQDCATGSGCRDLAVLMSDAAGLLVDLVRDSDDAQTEQIGTGAPFYYSWSPDGSRMLWQRNNRRLDIYDVASGDVETLDHVPGRFQAPAWSPVDDRLLFGALVGDATDLVIVADGEEQTLVPGLGGAVAFSWSPDGNYVAYVADQGPLFVMDAITGESVARSPVSGVFSFFWSPDSSRIAYITLASPPGSFSAGAPAGGALAAMAQGDNGLAWSILDVATGDTHRYPSFIPTRDMVYLLAYFDQFAQSHRIWSPDSRHLIYSEATADNRPVISLLDVTRADSVPLSIAEGLVAIWSFA